MSTFALPSLSSVGGGGFHVPIFRWGGTCVFGVRVPPPEDCTCHDKKIHAPVLRGPQHVLRHVLHVLCSLHPRKSQLTWARPLRRPYKKKAL